ncbi:uncharacterized protein LOC143365514 [Halictus rubicundus]|uniref:uncharacterized protein LOC143365514 n=1 Tax=Halictus rubicundus TaxID=77578 RepID=UPI00403589AC
MPKKFSNKNHRVVHFKGDFKRRIGATVNVIDIEPANETDSSKNQEKVPTNRDILNDFLESTSIHGLQYFGKTDVKVGVFGKSLWTFTMLLGFACSTVMVIQFLNRYNENPTNTFIKAFNNPIFKAPFPAVTLCPFSPIPQERQKRILDGINIPANMSTKVVLDLLNKNVTSDDAILRVFMHAQVFVTMETVSAADEVYLLASIGGIFSLFLGSSFLSVVEILYFVKLFCHAVYRRRKNGSTAKKRKRRSYWDYEDYEDYEDTRRNIY